MIIIIHSWQVCLWGRWPNASQIFGGDVEFEGCPCTCDSLLLFRYLDVARGLSRFCPSWFVSGRVRTPNEVHVGGSSWEGRRFGIIKLWPSLARRSCSDFFEKIWISSSEWVWPEWTKTSNVSLRLVSSLPRWSSGFGGRRVVVVAFNSDPVVVCCWGLDGNS